MDKETQLHVLCDPWLRAGWSHAQSFDLPWVQPGSWCATGSAVHGWLECIALLWRIGSLSRRDEVNMLNCLRARERSGTSSGC